MPIQHIMSYKYYCIDETMKVTKKVNKHNYNMSGLVCASLATYIIPNVTFSRQLLIPNHHKGVQE